MSEVRFEYGPGAVTPELFEVSGRIMIQWALLDRTVAHMTFCLWQIEHLGQKLPQSFKQRAKHLYNMTKILYQNEPDEWLQMAWFIQRLRSANGKRDDIAHGVPGIITIKERTYVGLQVIMPGEMPRHVAMTIDDLKRFHDELKALDQEAGDVSIAVSAALIASSQNILTSPNPGGLVPVSPGGRSPMLPRDRRPPSTFQA